MLHINISFGCTSLPSWISNLPIRPSRHTHTHRHTRTDTHTHTRTDTHAQTHTHRHTRTDTHAQTHTHRHTRTDTHAQSVECCLWWVLRCVCRDVDKLISLRGICYWTGHRLYVSLCLFGFSNMFKNKSLMLTKVVFIRWKSTNGNIVKKIIYFNIYTYMYVCNSFLWWQSCIVSSHYFSLHCHMIQKLFN